MNSKNIIFEMCVCQKCRKPFKSNGMKIYCPACTNFGSRKFYRAFLISLLYYFVVNFLNIISDFSNLKFTQSYIFLSFYLSAFLFCFCSIMYVWIKICKKVGK